MCSVCETIDQISQVQDIFARVSIVFNFIYSNFWGQEHTRLGNQLFCVRFPACPKKRQIWLNQCRLTNKEVLPNRKICSFHFEPTCFKSNVKRRLLHPDAVPTIFENSHVKTRNLPLKIVKGTTHFFPICIAFFKF